MPARAPRSWIDGLARPSFPRPRLRSDVSVALFQTTGHRSLRRKKRIARRILGLAGIVIVSVAALAALGSFGHLVPRDAAALDRYAASLGFGITRLDIQGHRYTQRPDIVAALALPPGASQLALDTTAAKNRIETLPWVLKAGIHRSLPDGLFIEITERRPAIVWRAVDHDVLLDIEGRELSTLPGGSDLGLPVVTGASAGPAASGFLPLLEQHSEIRRRTVEIRRIEGRRWSLQLSNGLLVHLPADGIAASLAWLESRAASGLLDLGLETIDLRVTGQLVVRGPDAPGVGPAARSRHTPRTGTAAGGAP